jgi:hypothetical protein
MIEYANKRENCSVLFCLYKIFLDWNNYLARFATESQDSIG